MKATVSEKGQVTIPKSLRTQLGIKSGSVLEFTEQNGKLMAQKKIETGPEIQWRGKGKLPFGNDVDDYIRSIRDR